MYPIENGVPDLCVIDPMAIDCEATTLPSTVSVTSFDVLAHVMVCQAPSLRLGPPGRVMRFCDPTKMHCACDFPPWGKSSILYCGVALADRIRSKSKSPVPGFDVVEMDTVAVTLEEPGDSLALYGTLIRLLVPLKTA